MKIMIIQNVPENNFLGIKAFFTFFLSASFLRKCIIKKENGKKAETRYQ
jgi:hypothetical protein